MSDLTKQFEAIDQKLDKTLEGQGEAKQKAAALDTEISTIKKSVGDVDLAVKEAQNIINTTKTELEKSIKVVTDEVDLIKSQSAKIIESTKGESKPFSEVLKSSLEPYTDELAKIARKDNGRNQNLKIDIKAVADVTTANITGGTVWSNINRGGIVLNPDRKVHMRDLLPGGTLGPGSVYTFMRENGVGEGAPTFVAEGATKPQFDMDLVEASVQIETLAGWVRVTRKAMQNIPGFISYLQMQMPKRLLKAEDAGILYGSGTTPEIKGLLTSGNFVASTSVATVLAEKIIDDIAVLNDTYERDATGIAMRPIHYASFFKNKAAGSGEYDLPQNVVFVNGQLYIGGIPVVQTTGLNINLADTPDSADYMVGDFTGAQFLIQEGMRIEFFEQDGDNVRTNKVTVRIEETVALPVFGSTYFIKGTHTIV